MQPGFDLTPRQTARVLEQALRARTRVEIEIRKSGEERDLLGTLDGREAALIRTRLDDSGLGLPVGVIGAFCDVRLVLAESLYWFTTYVVDLLDAGRGVGMLLATPDVIQVANRRRFERRTVPTAAEARLRTPGAERSLVALLGDVSAEGLSCTLPTPAADDGLLVGDPVEVSFELPGFDETFALAATVCNKAVSRDRELMTVGLEFAPPADPAAPQRSSYQRFQTALQGMVSDSLS